MKSNRTLIAIWTLIGCVVFAAVGMQLAGNAWGGIDPAAVEVRGQSPDPIEAIVIDIENDQNEMSRMEVAFMILYLAIFMLAIFVGFEVITKVPPTLHTPLMSGSNAISGITLVGAIIVAGQGWHGSSVLGMIAVALAMINVVGGFLVTHRMLAMFQSKRKA